MTPSAQTQRAWWWLAPSVVAFAICLPSLTNTFVWDDLHLIVHNAKIQGEGAFGAALSADFWDTDEVSADVRGAYYRPVIKLAHVLEWRLFGSAPLGWHLVNSLLHAVATALAALFIRRALGQSGASSSVQNAAAAGGALLWAVHPARVENVAWVCGSTDEVMLVFLLGALLVSDPLESERWWPVRSPRWWLALVGFTAAALSKEAAYLVPVLLIIDALLKGRVHRAQLSAAGGIVIAVIIRLVVRGAPAGIAAAHTTQPTHVFGALGFYGAHALWPSSPAVYAGAFPLLDDGSWLVPTGLIVAGALMLVALAGLVVIAIRRPAARPWLSDVAWFVVPLLPVLHLMRPLWSVFASERFLALPLLGLCTLVARTLLRPWRWRFAVVSGVALVFGLVSANHMTDFRDDETLWSFELLQQPDNALAQESYATFLVQQHRFNEAVPVLRALVRQPGSDQQVDRRLMALVKALRATTPDADHRTWAAIGSFYRALLLKEAAPRFVLGDDSFTLREDAAIVIQDQTQTSIGGDFDADALEGLARGGQLALAVRFISSVVQAPKPNIRRFVLSAQTLAWAEAWADARRMVELGNRSFPNEAWAKVRASIDEAERAEAAIDGTSESAVRRARAWVGLQWRARARRALADVSDPTSPEVIRARIEIALADGDEAEAARIDAEKR